MLKVTIMSRIQVADVNILAASLPMNDVFDPMPVRCAISEYSNYDQHQPKTPIPCLHILDYPGLTKLSHPSKPRAATQRTSSPAAGSGARNERNCRQSWCNALFCCLL